MRKEQRKIKLSLGCGIKLQPGFINVDRYTIEELKEAKGVLHEAEVKGRYVQGDVRALPFKDNYADYILATEIIEHIPLSDVVNTLKEWVRVLKPGGRMVITAPDFNALAKQWLETPFSPETYGDMAQGIYGNQLAPGEFHQSPITPQFFQYYLGSMGLKEGKIFIIPRGDPMKNYPGKPARKGQVYRFGEVHIDCRK